MDNLLIKQTGNGLTVNFRGKEWQARRSNMVFSNQKLHKTMLNIIQAK